MSVINEYCNKFRINKLKVPHFLYIFSSPNTNNLFLEKVSSIHFLFFE